MEVPISDALLLEGDPISCSDELLKSAAGKLKGTERRQFLAEVCQKLCDGNARLAERRFGWGRETIECGARERDAAARGEAPATSGNRGKQRSEVANPQLAIDIQLIGTSATMERRVVNVLASRQESGVTHDMEQPSSNRAPHHQELSQRTTGTTNQRWNKSTQGWTVRQLCQNTTSSSNQSILAAGKFSSAKRLTT